MSKHNEDDKGFKNFVLSIPSIKEFVTEIDDDSEIVRIISDATAIEFDIKNITRKEAEMLREVAQYVNASLKESKPSPHMKIKASMSYNDLKESNINPGHYKQGNIETIDFIDSITPYYKAQHSFYIANVAKYISRAPLKNGLEDLKKAKWYLDRLIDIWQDRIN